MNRIPDIVTALAGANCVRPSAETTENIQPPDAILLTGPINRRWATGFSSSAGALVVTKTESVFITDSRYIEAAEAKVRDAQVVQIKSGQSYADIISEVLERNNVKCLGFEEDVMTQGAYTNYRKKVTADFVPAQRIVEDLRVSKTPAEYALMQKAQAITDQTFAEILPLITPAITERELTAEIVYRLLKNGAERPAFDPIVVSGPRASMPHGTPGAHRLMGFVILDFGAVYEGYCADMTRTVAIGEPTAEMRRVYETVLSAQLAGIQTAKAGVIGKDLDSAARDVIAAAGYGDYFGHSFGHGLGLEVHEAPRAAPTENRSLPKGAVLSAEPGIYLPGEFGVRIEDTLYLVDSGCEILTKTPKQLIIL